jgi:uncharacterized membrane protein YhaH (DUF805 family)
MVSFPDAIKQAFAKYATFAGRATRAEFWWFALFVWLLTLVPYILLLTSLPAAGKSVGGAFWLWLALDVIIVLAVIVPYISVAVRRLHDINKSGWWYWITLVPCIGGIWLLVLLATPSTPGQNQFG